MCGLLRVPSVGKAGVLCWTALSSRSSRSSSDRLLPRVEFMADDSLLFCLLGKLSRVKTIFSINRSVESVSVALFKQ